MRGWGAKLVLTFVCITAGALRARSETAVEVSDARVQFPETDLTLTLLHLYTIEDDVTIAAHAKPKLAALALRFYQRTGKLLHVTSGVRLPEKQAEIMLDRLRKLGRRGVRIYKFQDAAQEIRSEYNRMRRARAEDEAVVAHLADVIRAQIAGGVFVSRHLFAGSVDVRNMDMSPEEKRAFKEIAADLGVRVLHERRPPHFHLDIPLDELAPLADELVSQSPIPSTL